MFGILDENIQTLIRLELTSAQAKAYLTLATLKTATAKELSHHSDIAREEVYRLLAQLQKKGLIERIISSPTQFKAIPLEQGFAILIRRKEKEISEIKKETSKIIEDFKQNNTKPTINEQEPQFTLIPGKEALIMKLKKMIENTEKTTDVIIEGHAFGKFIFELFEVTSEALRRNVRFRVIIGNPIEKKLWKKTVQEFAKYANYKIKTLTVKHSLVLAINDKKEVIVICFSRKNFADSPAIWSNNANLIEIAQHCFESMWEKAI